MRLPYAVTATLPKRFGAARPHERIELWIAVALILRSTLAASAGILEHDGAYYLELARAALRGDWAHAWSPMWPPLYPALVALAALPLTVAAPGATSPEALEAVARGVSVVAGALALIPLHRISVRVLGARHGWIPVALAATHPRLVQYSAAALTESVSIALLTWGLAAALAAIGDRRSRTELAAGVVFGVAYLARPEALALAAAAWVGVAWAGRRLALPFVGGVAAVVLPWAIVLSVPLGRPTLGEKGGYNFWRAHRDLYAQELGVPPRIADHGFDSPALLDPATAPRVRVVELVARRPVEIAQRSLASLGRIVTQSLPLACYLPYFVLALAGASILGRRELAPLAAVVVAGILVYAPFSTDRRFFVTLVPWILVLAGAGLARAESWIGARRAGRVPRVGFAATCALCLFGPVYTLVHPPLEEAPEHRAAGRWLRDAWPGLAGSAGSGTDPAGHPPVVMSRKTWVPYYAQGWITELPEADLDSIRARVAVRRADVLVIDERWGVATRPWLSPLLDPRRAPPGTRPLWWTDAPRRIVLYDVREWRRPPGVQPSAAHGYPMSCRGADLRCPIEVRRSRERNS